MAKHAAENQTAGRTAADGRRRPKQLGDTDDAARRYAALQNKARPGAKARRRRSEAAAAAAEAAAAAAAVEAAAAARKVEEAEAAVLLLLLLLVLLLLLLLLLLARGGRGAPPSPLGLRGGRPCAAGRVEPWLGLVRVRGQG